MQWRKILMRQVLPVAGVVLALVLLVFLLMKTQGVDGDLHLERLANLRVVNALDVELNRALTQQGAAPSDAAQQRVAQRLDDAIAAIDQQQHGLRGLDPTLDRALDKFLLAMREKLKLGSGLLTQNQVLQQRVADSLLAVEAAADAAVAAAPADQHAHTAATAATLRTQVLRYVLLAAPDNEPAIQSALRELKDAAAAQPANGFDERVGDLSQRCLDVIDAKAQLARQFQDFLDRPTGASLQQVEQAYSGWHEAQTSRAELYRLLLVAYAGALLAGLSWLGVRLGRSYRQLSRARKALLGSNARLGKQVDIRTQDLTRALDELRTSQAQLLQSEKMASLGQMVAGVAHEINTPLGYARSNTGIVRSSLAEMRDLSLAQARALQLLSDPQASEQQIAQAIEDAQTLGATTDARELVEELDNLLGDADHGLTQIAELVAGLKDFSRVDRSRNDRFNVNDGIESALKICHNQLKHRIEVVKHLGLLPPIECAPSQINQVLLNLFTNAAQAIDGNGKIYIHTSAEDKGVAIRVLDTGCGMPEDVRARIFEPFYTTKPVGVGTGLGLSIVYRIVEDHGGRIDVRSTPGKGTEFSIHLPLKQNHAAERAPALAAA